MIKNKWPYVFILFLIGLLAWDNRGYFWKDDNQVVDADSTVPPTALSSQLGSTGNSIMVNDHVYYVIPGNDWSETVTEMEQGVVMKSPNFAYDDSGTYMGKGMQIMIYTDTGKIGAFDPQAEFDNIKNNTESLYKDITEVNIAGVPGLRYHVDYEGHHLEYFVIVDGYGWRIRFDTVSYSEEKKMQSIIDSFLNNLKFKDQSEIKKLGTQNNWRTYEGKTFSFQYPNSWADPVVGDETVAIPGNLVVTDASYLNGDGSRQLTYAEYVKINVKSGTITTPISIGNLRGVRYIGFDNTIEIILSNGEDSTRIYTISYLGGTDPETAKSIFDPILATFKFK